MGGSIALEDVVVLKPLLKQDDKELIDKIVAHQLLREFENSRVPRVRKIFFDQKAKVELAYKQGFSFKNAVQAPSLWNGSTTAFVAQCCFVHAVDKGETHEYHFTHNHY